MNETPRSQTPAVYPDLGTTLRNVFILQCRADLDHNRMELLQSQREDVRAVMAAHPAADDCILQLSEQFATAEYRASCRTFSDLSTIQERLAEQNCITFVFQGIDGQWLLATAVPELVDEAGTIHSVLFLVRNSTAQIMEKQLARQKLEQSYQTLDEALNILHSMQNIYFTGFYVDILHDRYKTLFIAPWLADFTDTKGNFSTLVQTYLEHTVLPEDRRRLSDLLNRNYICAALHQEMLSVVHHSFCAEYRSFRNGELKWCRVTIIVVDLDESGAPYHVLAVLQDITEHKEREAEYQRQILDSARKAQQANDAKTEFLHRISHDIRTPINGIQGMLRIASCYPNDPEKQKQCRDKIQGAANHLLDLVNDVLDMSKLESGSLNMEPQPFNINDLLNQINPIMESQAVEKGVQYEIGNNKRTHLDLIGCPLYLRQILLNIAGNALKYNHPGGYIRVACRELSSDDSTAFYQFVCEDNGQGMSEEFQQRMFDPFTQENPDARTNYSGTGLGLAITKRLVDQMGGSIEVESRKGVGSTFTVNFPLRIDPDAKASDRRADAQPSGSVLQGARILLAEDNDLNAEVAQFLLEQQGAQVQLVQNGLQAVEAFRQSAPGELDAILMDIMMPVMDGLAATRNIRKLPRTDAASVPIIAMTANAFADDIQKCRQAGMDAHIAKPLDMDKMNQLLARCIQQKKGQ